MTCRSAASSSRRADLGGIGFEPRVLHPGEEPVENFGRICEPSIGNGIRRAEPLPWRCSLRRFRNVALGYVRRVMKRAEKAERIQKILDELYPAPKVPLRHGDPYTLLISVLLSAQCTDERVNQVTPELFARAATPEDMVRLTVPQIRRVIRSCGLAPAKARAIRGLSRILVEEHAEPGSLGLRVPRGAARGGTQDRQCRDDPGIRQAGASRRHAHPPACVALGTVPGQVAWSAPSAISRSSIHPRRGACSISRSSTSAASTVRRAVTISRRVRSVPGRLRRNESVKKPFAEPRGEDPNALRGSVTLLGLRLAGSRPSG